MTTNLHLYHRILRCYKTKKFKLGVKLANEILTQTTSQLHTKSSAWKSLFLGLLGRTDSGIQGIRKALRKDHRSSFCWHVYGRLCTMQGDFHRAIDCYENALKYAPDQRGIVKDLAQASIQVGDITRFQTATVEVLQGSTKSRQLWMQLAVALQISGDLDGALKIVSIFDNSEISFGTTGLSDWEYSEFLLYHNCLIRQSGGFKSALNHLLKNRYKICDSLAVDESLMEIYLATGQHSEAMTAIHSLLQRNPNNKYYYENMFEALHVKHKEEKVKFLEEFIENNPKASVPKMLILKYSSGNKFLQYLTNHLKDHLEKGSPNLFTSIKSLMQENTKKIMITSLLSDSVASGKNHTDIMLVSSYICIAKVFDFGGDFNRALDFVQKAMLINPLNPDVHLVKAKIMKHAQNPIEACKAMERALQCDPLDEWLLQMKLIKYLLRANMIEQADKIFVNTQNSDEPEEDKTENFWYLYEKTAAYRRVGKFDEAMIVCEEMNKAIKVLETHTFPLQTMYLEQGLLMRYKQFLEATKNIKSNKFYLKAAAVAVESAIHLQDRKMLQFKKQHLKDLKMKAGNSKLKNISRAAENRCRNTTQSQKGQSDDSCDFELPKGDPTYFYNHLLKVGPYLKTLQKFEPNKIETHLLCYKVYSRMNKPFLMLQSLLKVRQIDKNHHKLLMPTIHFYAFMVKLIANNRLPQNHAVVLLKLGNRRLWKNKDMKEITYEFLEKHGKNLKYLLEGGKALYKLDPAKKEDAVKLACYVGEGTKNRDVPTCLEVLESLSEGSFGQCTSETENFRTKCREIFKHTSAFDSEEVQKIRQQEYLQGLEGRTQVT